MNYRPFVLDSVNYWKFFKDDTQLKRFLELIEDFSAMNIDHRDNEDDAKNLVQVDKDGTTEMVPNIVGHKILLLKNNFILKGLVPLEQFFEKNDVSIKPVVHLTTKYVDKINIGIVEDPKCIKVSQSLSNEHKNNYPSIFKQHLDVFSWMYKDFKTHDTSIIQLRIPFNTLSSIGLPLSLLYYPFLDLNLLLLALDLH